MAGGNHATTVAFVTAKENAEGNREGNRVTRERSRLNLSGNGRRHCGQAPLCRVQQLTGQVRTAPSAFQLQSPSFSYTTKGRSHHWRTSVTQVPKSTVRSSSLLETKRDTRQNSKGIRENTTKNGATGKQFNVMFGTVPNMMLNSRHVLIYPFSLQSPFPMAQSTTAGGRKDSPHLLSKET